MAKKTFIVPKKIWADFIISAMQTPAKEEKQQHQHHFKYQSCCVKFICTIAHHAAN